MSPETPEPLDEGGTRLLDLVAAVDYLRRGLRPGITVWEAIAEALQQTRSDERRSEEPDSFQPALTERLSTDESETLITIQTAIRRWLDTMADRYNDGCHWPHPSARREFPPPRLDPTDD